MREQQRLWFQHFKWLEPALHCCCLIAGHRCRTTPLYVYLIQSCTTRKDRRYTKGFSTLFISHHSFENRLLWWIMKCPGCVVSSASEPLDEGRPLLHLANSSTPLVVGVMATGFITPLCSAQFCLCPTALFNCLLSFTLSCPICSGGSSLIQCLSFSLDCCVWIKIIVITLQISHLQYIMGHYGQ